MVFNIANYEAVYHQILSVIPVSLCEFTMGFVAGWLAPALKKLLENGVEEMATTRDECSWIASLNEIGQMLGSIISIVFMDILGRAFLLRTGGAIMFLAWLIIALTRSVLILTIIRFATGIGVGICYVLTSLYLGENCSPRIRGISSCVSLAAYYFGVLLSFVLGTYLSYSSVGIISVIISLTSLLSGFLLVESPQFLTIRGKHEEAEKNLMWLRGTDNKNDVFAECENIKSNIASEKLKKSSIKKMFSSKANCKSLVIVLVIAICQPATGSTALSSYISIIFPSNASLTSNEFTIWFAIIQLVAAVLCSVIIEKFNRRTLALLSTAAFVICHICIASLCYAGTDTVIISSNPVIVFLLIGVYLVFKVVIDAVFYMLRGEMFPQSIKPIGSGMCIIAQALMSFGAVKVFLMIAGTYGIYINFIIYSIVGLLTFIFCYFVLPETRGKSLIEIQRILEK